MDINKNLKIIIIGIIHDGKGMDGLIKFWNNSYSYHGNLFIDSVRIYFNTGNNY